MQMIIAYIASMYIENLHIFTDVMLLRSFTDVAKKKNTAPSSISRSIANLEKDLGVRLFHRTTRKLEPTEAGLLYYEQISPLLMELDNAKQAAIDINQEPKGTLRITASTVYGQMYITPLLPILTRKYPLLKIELLLTDTYLDLIEERIDVSIRLGVLQDSSYVARKLSNMELFICATPKYLEQQPTPKQPKDIQNHDCLIFPRPGYSSTNWMFKQGNDVVKVPIQGQCLITNSKAIKHCTLSDMGLALLPDWLIHQELESGELVRVFEDFTTTATDFDGGVYVLYPTREYIPLKTKVFIDLLNKNIPQTHVN